MIGQEVGSNYRSGGREKCAQEPFPPPPNYTYVYVDASGNYCS